MQFTNLGIHNGWADWTLQEGEQTVSLRPSYLSDALGDLLQAVDHLLQGEDALEFAWLREPGEIWWRFNREGDRVRLQLVGVGLWQQEPTEPERLMFEAVQPLTTLAAAFADGAQVVLSDLGEDGYLAAWVSDPFPILPLRRIQDALSMD